jgi:hypothetical protein
MKRSTLFVGLVTAVFVVFALFLLMQRFGPGALSALQRSARVSTDQLAQHDANRVGVEKREKIQPTDPRVASVLAAYAVPITFHGKVVDEIGNPIPGATIKLGATDSLTGDGTYYHRMSDEAGFFELHGARGLAVAVWVSKEGYYTMERYRGMNFTYGGVRGKHDPKNPTSDNPAIFVLHKIGKVSRLVHVPLRTIKIPKDGTPVEVDITTGRPVKSGMGQIVFEVKTMNHDIDPNEMEPYEWEASMRVVSGGVVERKAESDFEAPEGGYKDFFRAGMKKGDQPWRKGFENHFFAKLGNGQFARFQVELTTAGDHFITLETFLNPTPGDRNLYYDVNKD